MKNASQEYSDWVAMSGKGFSPASLMLNPTPVSMNGAKASESHLAK